MRVTLAQINTTVGDVRGNVEKAVDALKRATDAGAELVALPELTIPGYPPEDLFMRPAFIKDNCGRWRSSPRRSRKVLSLYRVRRPGGGPVQRLRGRLRR